MAKAPIAGAVKTRLIPALGDEGAAELAKKMLCHTIEQALAADDGSIISSVELNVDPPPDHQCWDDAKWRQYTQISKWNAQTGSDLGERMATVVRDNLEQDNGKKAVILIGSDCPAIDSPCLQWAAAALRSHKAVLVPSFDGGYVLFGLRAYEESLFSGITWSSENVLQDTYERLRQLCWPYVVMPPLPDIDRPQDMQYLPAGWQQPA